MMRITDTLDIHQANAILDIGETRIWRQRLAREIGFHRCHARVDEHQSGIVLRNDSRRLHELMVAGEKVLQKCLTHLLRGFVQYVHLMLL